MMTDLLYVGGLLAILQPLAWILIIGGWVAFTYTLIYLFLSPLDIGKLNQPLINRGGYLVRKFDSRLVFFFALSVLLWLFSFNQQLNFVDEFRHWSLVARYLCDYNQFPTVNSPIAFMDYLPGMGLFQYWCMQLLGYSVPHMYFAQTLLIAAGVTALLGNLSWHTNKKAFLFLLFAIGIGLIFLTNALVTLIAEPLMGVVWAALLIAYMTYRKHDNILLLLLPIIVFLYLIKSTGLLFAIMTWLYIAMDRLFCHYPEHNVLRRSWFWVWLLGLFILAATVISWKIHLSHLGAEPSYHSNVSWSYLFKQLPDKQLIIDAQKYLKHVLFFDSVSVMPGLYLMMSYKHFNQLLNVFSIFIILASLFFLQVWLYFTYQSVIERKQFRRVLYWIWMIIGGFLLGLFYSYEFLFPPQAKLLYFTLSRYMGAPVLGIFLFTFAMIAQNMMAEKLNRRQIGIVIVGIVFLVAISSQMPFVFLDILTQKKLYETKALQDYQPLARQVIKDIPPFSRLYVIDQQNAFLAQLLSDKFYPLKMTYNIFVSTPTTEKPSDFLGSVSRPVAMMGDHQFAALLQQQDYLLLISSDALFWQKFSGFFAVKNIEDEVYLFKIDHQHQQQLVLIKTYPAVKITYKPDPNEMYRTMGNIVLINL